MPNIVRRAARRISWAAEFLSSNRYKPHAIGRGHDAEIGPSTWPAGHAQPEQRNDLRTFFEGRTAGPGIWKWQHYFDIYDEHFRAFRNRAAHVLEIGVYSGGSLDMWRDYFGPEARLYGVDIEPACKAYERPGTEIFIGDQADRSFWKTFKAQVPLLDIAIDDGGHRYEQQAVTLEELLPHLRPGGVYICEDVHKAFNRFASYVHGMGHRLNACESPISSMDDAGSRVVVQATPFQSAVASIHLYPYVAVIKKRGTPMTELVAPKKGTEWQPFLK